VESVKKLSYTFFFFVITFGLCNWIIGQNPTFAFISTLTLYTLIDLLKSIGKTIPIMELTVFLMVVQMLYAPALELYFFSNYFPNSVWRSLMFIDPEIYFDFTLPATLFFIVGIYIPYRRKSAAERITEATEKLKLTKAKIEKTGIALILIGFSAGILSMFIKVGSLKFIFFLLEYFQFIGMFYLILSQSKFMRLAIVFIMIPFIIFPLPRTQAL